MTAAARWIVLLALCGLTFFFRLGATAITDSDEAYYAEAGREMVESGDWVTPHFNYENRFEKPVLFYWLIAATYTVAGIGEAQARLFAALAGVGLVFVAYGVGRRWLGAPQGLLAGVIIATSFGVFWMARSALPDLPLTFFLTLGTWAAIEAMAADATRPRAWLLLFAACVALAFLTKGPLAFAVPATVIVPMWLWERHAARREGTTYTPRFGFADVALAAGLFAAIALPWLVMITRAHPDFLPRMIFTENLERFATSKYNSWRGWTNVPTLIGDLAPWSAFLLLWVKPGWRWLRRQRPLARVEARLLIWAAAPFALFSISIGSQPRYILPCLVPLAILLARTIRARSLQAAVTRQRLFSTAGVLAGLTIAGIAVLAHQVSSLKDVYPHGSSGWSTIALVAAAIVVLTALQASRRMAEVLAVGSVVMLLAVMFSITPPRPDPVEIAAAPVLTDQPDVVCACSAYGRNLTFYARRQIVAGAYPEEIRDVLARPERVYAVVDTNRLPKVEQMLGRTFRRLSETPYLNIGQLKLDTFVSADSWLGKQLASLFAMKLDPARGVQDVILISNR